MPIQTSIWPLLLLFLSPNIVEILDVCLLAFWWKSMSHYSFFFFFKADSLLQKDFEEMALQKKKKAH